MNLLDFGVFGNRSPGGLINLGDLFGKGDTPAPAPVAPPVNITLPASSGVSPQMLMFGGLGLAALYLMTRK